MLVEPAKSASILLVAGPVHFFQTHWQTAREHFRRLQARLGLARGQRSAQKPKESPPHDVVYEVEPQELRPLFWVPYAVDIGFGYLLALAYLGCKKETQHAPLSASSEEFATFRHGLCCCLQRCDICCWALCCPSVRWSDNLTSMGTGIIVGRAFWLTWWVYATLLFILAGCTDVNVMFLLAAIVAALGASFRQELRRKFKMIRVGSCTFLEDFCLYYWCTFCVIVQEARQIEDAHRAGHPAVREPGA